MKSIDDILKNYSKSTEVPEGFENRVFSKIRRKKTVRKASYFAFFMIVFLTTLLSIFVFFPDSNPDNRLEPRLASGFSEQPGQVSVKEEIPVIEDVFFASYDADTRYAIEQVSYSEEDEGI